MRSAIHAGAGGSATVADTVATTGQPVHTEAKKSVILNATMLPTAELLQECGGLDQVLEDLGSIRRSQKAFSGQHRQLSREHPNQWVAFHNGKMAALADSLDGVLEAADEKKIPRGKMVIRYLDPDPKLMIL